MTTRCFRAIPTCALPLGLTVLLGACGSDSSSPLSDAGHTDAWPDDAMALDVALNVALDVALDAALDVARAPQKIEGVLIDDFEDGNNNTSNPEGYWYFYDDRSYGGASSIAYTGAPDGGVAMNGPGFESERSLEVTYTLDQANLPFAPYVGWGIWLGNNNAALDASRYRGVGYTYRGGAHRIRVDTSDVTDYDSFGLEMPASVDWNTALVLFSQLTQEGFGKKTTFNPKNVSGVSFMARGATGTQGKVNIDNLMLLTQLSEPPHSGALTRAELLADFDFLSNALLSTNPLAFTDKTELENFIVKERERLRDGMAELDFYRVLNPIVVRTQCGHSGIALTPATEAKLRADQRYLPILVRIVDSRLFVLSPLLATGLPPGSEITAINGRPVSEILSAMYENITTDGTNITRKAYVANRVFNDLYSLFVDSAPLFRIGYRSAQGETPSAIDLAGIRKAELERQAAEAGFPYDRPESGPAYSFVADRPGPALLAVRTFIFSTPGPMTDYERFIDQAFNAIRERAAKALVLDLRGNGGGDPMASSYLFARLIDKPAQYFADGTSFYPTLTQAMKPSLNAFAGKLVVLIDGASFSSTGHLCSLLRYYNRAVFVGEESGGSWITTDSSRDFFLPSTGMRLRTSRMAFKTAVSGMPLGRGIIPDHEVSASIDDLIANRDAVLQKGLELASQ